MINYLFVILICCSQMTQLPRNRKHTFTFRRIKKKTKLCLAELFNSVHKLFQLNIYNRKPRNRFLINFHTNFVVTLLKFSTYSLYGKKTVKDRQTSAKNQYKIGMKSAKSIVSRSYLHLKFWNVQNFNFLGKNR